MNELRATLLMLGLRDGPASRFLRVSQDSLKKMLTGYRPTPPGILAELSGVHTRLTDTASRLVEKMDSLAAQGSHPCRFTLGITTTDDEARRLGWPSFFTHAILGATVVATCHHSVTLVDRHLPPGLDQPEEEIALL